MEKTIFDLDWRPIATAPADADLELSVYENGEYHAFVFPCRRDGAGWRDVRANRPCRLADPLAAVDQHSNHLSRCRVIFFESLLGVDSNPDSASSKAL